MMDNIPDHGLDTLLSLNGEIYDQGNGYWIKIEALLQDFFDEVDLVLKEATT